MRTLQKNLSLIGWLLSLLTVMLAVIVWGSDFKWDFDKLSSYRIFPLLGLSAFSLMWAHYMVAALRRFSGGAKELTKKYFTYSSFIVLAAFVLHPSLLVYQLWADGLGLPPGSYLENYVSDKAKWAALLGTASFFVFLAYELRYKFQGRSWWKYVQYASDAAMIGIFFHALRLGNHVQEGWYRAVWFFYGFTYLIAIIYIYLSKKKGEVT